MTPVSPFLRTASVILLAVALSACQSRPADEPSQTPAAAAVDRSAPTLEELKNASYAGVEEAGGRFTLADGRWEGKPFVEGGASVPSVTFVRDFRLTADLDGDGNEEAVVLLTGGTGGSGEMMYLAVVGRPGGQLTNIATAPMGDRVQVRQARIADRRIVVDTVQVGDGDPMCCPGDLVTRSWDLQAGALKEGAPTKTGRLSADTLGGSRWVLRAWSWDEPAPAEPEVTLELDGNRLVGRAGCNNYFATVTAGDMPGDLRVGPVGATRKMCPDPEMAVETRFMQQLEGVRQMRFIAGQLALPYTKKDESSGVMLFEGRVTP